MTGQDDNDLVNKSNTFPYSMRFNTTYHSFSLFGSAISSYNVDTHSFTMKLLHYAIATQSKPEVQ